jgi:predicted nucleic acid-binding protein
MKLDSRRIFLDTNILVNDFLYRYPQYGKLVVDVNRLHCGEAVRFIRQKRIHHTYIASFSIARFVSLLSDLKVPKVIVLKEMELLLAKNTIVSLTSKLIVESIRIARNDEDIKDIEDALQYIVCYNHACFYLLTLNTKDFKKFTNISVIHPSNHRVVNL